jgi:transposase
MVNLVFGSIASMKLHKNATLTPKQRQRIKVLYATGKHSKCSLAALFGVNRKTIAKWINRSEGSHKSSCPPSKPSKLTQAFREDVKTYRQNPATSHHGKVRIAEQLAARHSCSNPSNVYKVLQELQLNRTKTAKDKQVQSIPTGKHRTQMDIQQLPAIAGDEGFEYKISIIHLSTRIKYSEIHSNYESATIAAVYQRALDNLPPFLSLLLIMLCVLL